jgi:hypothetical protein
MLNDAENLYADLTGELERQDKKQDLKNFSPDERPGLIVTAIFQLKQKLKNYHFEKEEEEIRFFKSVLPKILSLYFYYEEKFELESIELFGTTKSKAEYVEKEFLKIEGFFREQSEFFRYYRSGRTTHDRDYFLRSSPWNETNLDLMAPLIDLSFCTVYSVKIAIILAYTRVEQYLVEKLSVKIDHPAALENKLEWTDSKRDLVEMIYAFKEQGTFNNGTADLKQITSYFETVFSISLNNVSSMFQEILSRKTGYSNYIDKLREKFLKRIDDIEGKHIR